MAQQTRQDQLSDIRSFLGTAMGRSGPLSVPETKRILLLEDKEWAALRKPKQIGQGTDIELVKRLRRGIGINPDFLFFPDSQDEPMFKAQKEKMSKKEEKEFFGILQTKYCRANFALNLGMVLKDLGWDGRTLAREIPDPAVTTRRINGLLRLELKKRHSDFVRPDEELFNQIVEATGTNPDFLRFGIAPRILRPNKKQDNASPPEQASTEVEPFAHPIMGVGEIDLKLLAQSLTFLMEALDCKTYAAFGRRCGVSPGYIADLANERNGTPSTQTLTHIAMNCCVTPYSLLTGTPVFTFDPRLPIGDRLEHYLVWSGLKEALKITSSKMKRLKRLFAAELAYSPLTIQAKVKDMNVKSRT